MGIATLNLVFPRFVVQKEVSIQVLTWVLFYMFHYLWVFIPPDWVRVHEKKLT